MTGIRDEWTPDCNLGYYDTFDLLITLMRLFRNLVMSEKSIFKRALDPASVWPDKDEFLDVVFWGRQIVSVVLGLIFGLTQFQGALALVSFCALNCLAVIIFVSRFKSIDEEEYGGSFEIAKEGFMTAFSSFMVRSSNFAVEWTE